MKSPTSVLSDIKKSRKSQSGAVSRVRVGMATCGISSGADKVYDTFKKAIEQKGLDNIEVVATGCVGRCDLEPMAEVQTGDHTPVMYIHLDEEKVKKIVDEHIAGGKILEEYTEDL